MPPVGFEPMTSWSSVSCSANWAREESIGDFWSELSFVSSATSHWTLFISRIKRAWLYKGLNDSHPQPNSDLVLVGRSGDWWSGSCELTPQWGQFLTKFILFCATLDLSDNLTEMRQIGISWKTQMFTVVCHHCLLLCVIIVYCCVSSLFTVVCRHCLLLCVVIVYCFVCVVIVYSCVMSLFGDSHTQLKSVIFFLKANKEP